MGEAPRVVIAHDDDLVRDMVGLACARGDVVVVAEATSFDELLERCGVAQPAVILTADRLGDTLVEEVLPALVCGGRRVIVLSADPSPERLSQLLSRDLCGYLSHDAGPDEVVVAIKAVARGEVALNPEVMGTIVHQWRRLRTQPVSVGSRRRPAL